MSLPIGTKIPLFAEGNATENDVLEGKTFSTEKGNHLKGTIKNRGILSIDPTIDDKIYGSGYFNNVSYKGLLSENNEYLENILKNIFSKKDTKFNEKIAKALIENKTVNNITNFATGKLVYDNVEFYKNVNVNNLDFKPTVVFIEGYYIRKDGVTYTHDIMYSSKTGKELECVRGGNGWINTKDATFFDGGFNATIYKRYSPENLVVTFYAFNF